MRSKWSAVDIAMLNEMWLCGMTSTDIAAILGRPRHAVMGRIDRSGLMGRQGDGIVRPCSADAARHAVNVAIVDYGTGRGDRRYDLTCRIVLALVADGRRSRRVAAVSGVDPHTVRHVLDALDRVGLWPRRGAPPARWWTDGVSRMRRDIRMLTLDMGSKEWAHAA